MQQNRRIGKEQPIEIRVEVQGNYLNFTQNFAEKENFVISKVSESQPLLGKNQSQRNKVPKVDKYGLE